MTWRELLESPAFWATLLPVMSALATALRPDVVHVNDWHAATTLAHLRPGPAFGRSPADPHFDPFWARLDEALARYAC